MVIKKNEFTKNKLNETSKTLKVIAEPNRLMLLEKIITGVQCNCELGKSLELAPNLVSHHLSVLCDSGLVRSKRDEVDGRWIYYSINKEKLHELQEFLELFFDENRIKPCQSSCGPQSTI